MAGPLMIRAACYMLAPVAFLSLIGATLFAADDFQEDQAEIKRLEDKLFSPAVTEKKIDALLKQLSDKENRNSSKAELTQVGHAFIPRITAFARTAEDIEARQACAEVVQALDSTYRTSPVGRQLATLYRRQASELLPVYWKRFRQDPLDHRATAMLLALEPEVVEKWLTQTDDKQDQLRYLLLRLRDLSPDGFSREKLRLYSDRQIRRALPDVFPVVTRNKKNYCRRVVGHVALGVVELESLWTRPREPYSGLLFAKEAIVTFRALPYRRQGVTAYYGYHLHSSLYPYYPQSSDSRRVGTTFVRRLVVPSFPGLYRVPLLNLTDEQCSSWPSSRNALKNPWWVERRLPEKLRSRFRFPARTQNERDPPAVDRIESEVAMFKPFLGSVKQPQKAAVSVVVLPPVVPAGSPPELLQAARAACDRLAGEISASGTIQIVNRSELERVLKEHKTSGQSNRPITAYSAMIRLEVIPDRLEPRTVIRVIELSTGNVLDTRKFRWPLKESDVAPMKVVCQSAVKNATRTVGGKTRVRWLGVQDTGDQVRMNPLAVRLNLAFRRSLEQSQNVLLVQHLEAATSQEESLLLLMGMSRLPGDRRFSPQADATIVLRLKEGNGLGKTFEETPITIGIRLRDAKHPDRDWIESSEVVKQFDLLIEQSWKRLSDKLTAIPPGSAGNVLKEMRIRRSQAEAEYRTAKNLFPDNFVTSKNIGKARSAIPHLEAALKIDPTFADPHLMLSQMFVGENTLQRRVLEAVKYVEHPHSDAKLWPTALAHSMLALQQSRRSYWVFAKTWSEIDEIDKSDENRRLISAVKLLVERAVSPSVRKTDTQSLQTAISVVGRGMRSMEVPLEIRFRWADTILKELDRYAADVALVTPFFREGYLNDIRWARINVAEIAAEDGLTRRAQQLLMDARTGVTPQNQELNFLLPGLRQVARGLDDKDALQEFERWAKSLSTTVGLLAVKWPQADVWKNSKVKPPGTGSGASRRSRPEVSATRLLRLKSDNFAGDYQFSSPIAVDDNRAYLMQTRNNRSVHWTYGVAAWRGLNFSQLVIVPLNESGRPIGKMTDVIVQRGRKKMTVWEPFVIPQQPKNVRAYGKLFAQARNGRLYLGTQSNGLLIFDPKKDTWITYGPPQGLPIKSVNSFFFLDDEKIYVAGGRFGAEAQHYTLNLRTGDVKLMHKANDAEQEYYAPRLVPMWRDEGKLVSRLRTELLSEKPKYRPNWRTIPIGSALDAAEVDGRQFFTTSKGLYEHDRQGKIVRSWLDSSTTRIGVNHFFSIPRINTTPHRGRFMVKAGKILVFIERSKGIVAFDPKSETWYGPLGNWNIYHAVDAKRGMWLAHDATLDSRSSASGTLYIDAEDFVQAARKAGRAYTSQQYGERLLTHADMLPLLDRAKLAVMLSDHHRALQNLNKILEAEPNNAEALFLRGLVHDRWGLNQPEQALADYRTLATLEDPAAQATGLFFEMMVHQQSRDFSEIARVCETIKRDIPNLEGKLHRDVDWWLKHAKKSLQ